MVENEKPIDPPFNTAAKIMTILEHILISMTAVVMAILTVIVSYQVFARYVLHNSPFWVEEFFRSNDDVSWNDRSCGGNLE